MRRANWLPAWLLVLCATPLHACPFCSAVSQTLSEEMDSMDVVVMARVVEAAEVSDPDNAIELPRSRFQVLEVLQGESWIKPQDTIEVAHYGPLEYEKQYLIMGTDPPQLAWSTPIMLSQQASQYVREVGLLEGDSVARLRFYQQYLEDQDELVARDAYDEFAKAPYSDVLALKDSMNHDQLVEWIKDVNVPATRRRLYLTMLGVCGSREDQALLEGFLRSDRREDKAGLNALIGCYLSLTGVEGLPLIEELFLGNPDAEYADTYSAIMALRFHGNEAEIIRKEDLLRGLRLVLDRPDLADLVIPDLARWEDWSVLARLVQLFEEADEERNWVRVPVVNYVRACPLPEAKEVLDKLSKIDPEAVERASTFFPFEQFANEDRSQIGNATAVASEAAAAEPLVPPEVPPDLPLGGDKALVSQPGSGVVVERADTPSYEPGPRLAPANTPPPPAAKQPSSGVQVWPTSWVLFLSLAGLGLALLLALGLAARSSSS
jgi:hypothetical protein